LLEKDPKTPSSSHPNLQFQICLIDVLLEFHIEIRRFVNDFTIYLRDDIADVSPKSPPLVGTINIRVMGTKMTSQLDPMNEPISLDVYAVSTLEKNP
jgi:hypothetical protein